MSSPATTLLEPAETAPPDPEGWARPLAVRQLEALGELAEQGLKIGRAIARRAEEAEPGDDVDLNALAMAHARVARAVRLTLMLQSRVAGELQAADEGAARRAAERAAEEARADPEYVRKARVERIVERLAKAEHGDDEDEIDRLVWEAGERLDDEDLYGDILDRPISELVARICADLGLEPDWSRLSEEAWAKAEIENGDPGWPIASSPARRGRGTPERGGGGGVIAVLSPSPLAGEHATLGDSS